MQVNSCDVGDIDYSQDILWSAFTGLILGIAIIVALRYYPGEPFDYVTKDEKEDIATPVVSNETHGAERDEVVTVEQVLEGITEESVLEKTERARKTFGISEDTIRTAVRKTKEDAKNGVSLDDELFSWSDILNVVVWCASLFATLYLFNNVTNGEIYRIFHGLFRTEFEAMNMPLPS